MEYRATERGSEELRSDVGAKDMKFAMTGIGILIVIAIVVAIVSA
jgi:hypothetical protein